VVDFDAAAGSVALSLESATRPTELYLDGRAVSDLNSRWAERVRPVAPEAVTVDAPDGLTLPGLLYRAPAGDGAVLLRVHGGPHLAFGNTFDLETQTQVAAGYHVLVPNMRGSAGFGSRFRALSVGEWGRADHADLMAFADWAVHSGTGDPSRLYLAGGSYGGYLINWTLTRTDRFRAAVSERSVSNLLSKYGTSDNGFTVNRYEFGGLDLFDAGAHELLDRSPLHHADKVTTPLLLVHGERDQRCPIEQSEQLFAALRRLGREVVFVRFPGESHGFTAGGRPDRRIERLKLIIAWLDAHPAAAGVGCGDQAAPAVVRPAGREADRRPG
jgi:dipeptidyl aminopeptidase/acylaminoacyl peptidase